VRKGKFPPQDAHAPASTKLRTYSVQLNCDYSHKFMCNCRFRDLRIRYYSRDSSLSVVALQQQRRTVDIPGGRF